MNVQTWPHYSGIWWWGESTSVISFVVWTTHFTYVNSVSFLYKMIRLSWVIAQKVSISETHWVSETHSDNVCYSPNILHVFFMILNVLPSIFYSISISLLLGRNYKPNFTDEGTKSYSCKITKAELKPWKSWFVLVFKICTFIRCVYKH